MSQETITVYSKREGAIVWGREAHQRIEQDRFYVLPAEEAKKLLAAFPGELITSEALNEERKNPLSDKVKEQEAALEAQSKLVADLQQKLAALEALNATSAVAAKGRKSKAAAELQPATL